MKHTVVGTAGHVDHGKTLLVKAMTGVDADRWEEEKRRGITMDIGFARLQLEGVTLHFVDLPGHERFVKNMVAGATAVDQCLIVVAADESVMPQTREHVDILDLLGVKRGVAALTKIDLVDEETRELALLETTEFLASRGFGHLPVIPVSAMTGEGVEAVVKALASGASVSLSASDRPFRLPVDRVFPVKGFGTVVTGTCVDGLVTVGERVRLFPSGRESRVRGLQVFGEAVRSVGAGRRAAVNLPDIKRSEVERGHVVGDRDGHWPARLLDVRLRVLDSARRPLKSGCVCVLHVHTQEVEAHVHLEGVPHLEPGATGLAQLRTPSEVVAWPGDRFILRLPSPARTVAGGEVLLPAKRKARWSRPRDRAMAEALRRGRTLEALLLEAGSSGLAPTEAMGRLGLTPEAFKRLADEAVNEGTLVSWGGGAWWLEASEAEGWIERAGAWLKARTEGKAPVSWIPRQELLGRWRRILDQSKGEALVDGLLKAGAVEAEGDKIRPAGHRLRLDPDRKEAWRKITAAFAGGDPPVRSAKELAAEAGKAAPALLPLLVEAGELVRFGGDFFTTPEVLEGLKAVLLRWKASTGEVITIPQFKELLGLTRRIAMPLLEYLDDLQWTRRVEGGRRILL